MHYRIYRALEQVHANGEELTVAGIHEREDVFFAGLNPHTSVLDLQALFFCKAGPAMFGVSHVAAHNQLES